MTCVVHHRADCGCPDLIFGGIVPAADRCPHTGCDYPAGTACTNALCPGRWPQPRRNRSSHPISPTDDRMTSGGGGHRAVPASLVERRA